MREALLVSGFIGLVDFLLMLRDEVAVVFDLGSGFAFEFGIGVESDVIETKVGLVIEGMAPFAIGGEGPAEVGADGDSFGADFGDFFQMDTEIFLAGDAVGEGDAAVFDDHDFLLGEPAMIAPHGMAHAFGPDGGVEETAFACFDQSVEEVKFAGRKAPIVVHANEVLRLVSFSGAKAFGELAADAEIPPIGVGDESGGSGEAPEEVEFAGLGFENLERLVVG